MSIYIKNSLEISKMRVVGKLASEILEIIEPYVKSGISTGELDRICHNYIIKNQHATSAILGYYGFPKSVCISVNDVVCHGIPSNKELLKEGDILNIDVTIMKDGFYCDTSKMYIVGNTNKIGKKLCQITKDSLYMAIKTVRPGIRLREIGRSIQNFVEPKRCSIVREYCGHGIGKNFHEEPQILHYDHNDYGIVLKPGMVFTIEPMINLGSRFVKIMQDGWTVKTKDKSLSAQYEHTIFVTKNGCEILTLRSDDTLPNIIQY